MSLPSSRASLVPTWVTATDAIVCPPAGQPLPETSCAPALSTWVNCVWAALKDALSFSSFTFSVLKVISLLANSFAAWS